MSLPVLGRSVLRRKQIQKSDEVYHKPQDLAHFEQFRQNAFGSGYDSIQEFVTEDLRHVEVIEQVDRKFIACRIVKRAPHPLEDTSRPPLSEGILVLVDQHAVDERIRVERFLKELCTGFLGTNASGVEVKELIPPRPVLLTQHEFLSIMGSQGIQDLLQKWGVQIVAVPKNVPESVHTSDPGSLGYMQIHVKTVPEIVGEKVGASFIGFLQLLLAPLLMGIFQLLQGDELRDFIKGFLGQIESGELFLDSRLDFPSEADRSEFAWLKAVRHCPKGLLELISSKACRGK